MEMAQLLPEFPLLNSTREQSPEHSGTTHTVLYRVQCTMYTCSIYVHVRNMYVTCSQTGRVAMCIASDSTSCGLILHLQDD